MTLAKTLTILLLLCSSLCLQAAQKAIVRRTKAKVYADPELTSPIGYIGRGKIIKVGEKKRKRGKIIPITVSGRIAWIKTEDVALEKDEGFFETKQQMHEHEIDLNFQTEAEKLSKNNFINVSYRPLSVESPVTNVPSSIQSQSSYSMSHFGVYFEHRPPDNKYHWGFGFGRYSLDTDVIELRGTTFEVTLSRSFFKNRYISAELSGDIILSGATTIESKPQHTFIFRDVGQAWGYRLGGILKFFPYDKYGFHLGAHIEDLNLTSIYPITYSDGTEGTVEGLSGQSLYLGFSYKL